LIASGSYADTGVTGDSHVAYRVTTSQSTSGYDEVVSAPSGFDYAYDIASELGYPNGYPVTGLTYNCTVEPQLHIDAARIAGHDHSASERITGGLNSIIRHDQSSDWTIVPTSANAVQAPMAKRVLNATSGNYRRTVSQLISYYGGMYLKRPLGTPNLGFPNGVTVFRAVHVPDLTSAGFADSGANLASGTVTVGGVDYTAGTMTLKATAMSCTLHWASVPVATVSRSWPWWSIYAYRLNNTLVQYNTGTIKGQLFADGGSDIATGANVASSSYHDATGTKGAYGMAANVSVSLNNQPYTRSGDFGEMLIFDEALDVNDMNGVFGYLCYKYGNTFTVLSAGDLVG
jgi:hypothetical protein